MIAPDRGLTRRPDPPPGPPSGRPRAPVSCTVSPRPGGPAMPPPRPAYVQHVEMSGHIIDSLLLPKVLDAILSRGGHYHIEAMKLGERQDDPSFARIEVKADTAEQLEA